MHLMKDGSIIIFYEKGKSLSDSNKTSHVFWKRCDTISILMLLFTCYNKNIDEIDTNDPNVAWC